MFRVLKEVWQKTPERYIGKEFPEHGYIYRVREWEELGVVTASDEVDAMQEANAKFPRGRKNGYSLILERIGAIH